MPYIKQENRKIIDKRIEKLIEYLRSADFDKQDGEVNYTVSKILHTLYSPSYYNYNRAIGVLECIKLELYRKMVAPYEEIKIKENGDI